MSEWHRKRWEAGRAAVKAAKAALREEKRLRQIDREEMEKLRGINARLEVMASVGWSVLDAVESVKVAMAFPPPKEKA